MGGVRFFLAKARVPRKISTIRTVDCSITRSVRSWLSDLDLGDKKPCPYRGWHGAISSLDRSPDDLVEQQIVGRVLDHFQLLQFGDRVAGYANYGRNRARSLFYDGEIYELYLCPEFQGLGFGRRLFTAARRDLAQSGLKSLVIWALTDNDPAVSFYKALGGRAVARSSERFGAKSLDKVAFGWQN